MAISEAERNRLRKLASTLTGIVWSDSMFMHLIKTIPNLPIAFEKEFYEKIVANVLWTS